MKLLSVLGASVALGASTVLAVDEYPTTLTKTNVSPASYMSPVRVIHARVQGDAPEWNDTMSMFVSKYGSSFETKFRAVLDTVNTASVEGALMYVQAEGINYATRSAETKCTRKNGMKNVVFYDIVIQQANATLAQYETEYGAMIPMDGGACTPDSGSGATAVYSKACHYLNGTDGNPKLGPFVGGEAKDTDPRAPYPNTWWYSFPNTCPLRTWNDKTDACRAFTPAGLCPYDTMPDGKTCTFNYRILGWVPIDDVVGITAMDNLATGNKFTNFSEFCKAGEVEFNGTQEGVWESGIDFWKQPLNAANNAARAAALVEAYTKLQNKTATSTQVDASVVAHFKPLPTPESLTTTNPECYKNVKVCATTEFGCKRTLYSQICEVCTAAAAECKVAPEDFTFPSLPLAVAPTPTPTTKTPTTTTAAPETTPATTTPAPSSSGAVAVPLLSIVVAFAALVFEG